MQELSDIIKMVNLKGVQPVKNFHEEELDGTKLRQLYEGVASGVLQSDDEAANVLYGTDASDKRYIMLRKNLTDRLLQTLVQYDYSKRLPALVNEKSWCIRSMFGITMLLSFGAVESAIRLVEKVLRRAEQFHFTDIRVQCLQILREKVSLRGDTDKYEEYDAALKSTLALQQAELEAEEMCQRIEIHFTRSSAEQPHIADLAEKYLRRLKILTKSGSSFVLDINTFRIKLYMLQIRHEYRAALKVCTEADAYLLDHPEFSSRSRRAEFMLTAMMCCLKMREYTQALEYGSLCSDLFAEGRYNWYLTLGTNLLLALHTADFDHALNIYVQAMSNKGIEELPEFQREKWLIYGAYLNLALEKQWLFTSPAARRKFSKIIRSFDLWTSLPAASQDKKGLKISIQTIEMLSLAGDEDAQGILTRLKLIQRHIRKNQGDKNDNNEEYLRTIQFLQMIRILVRSKFNKRIARRKAQPHYEALQALPRNAERFVEGIEVIPYEQLWEWLIAGGATQSVTKPPAKHIPS